MTYWMAVEVAQKYPKLAWLYFRILVALRTDTKPLEILSGLWFIALAYYIEFGSVHTFNILLPALLSVAPGWLWSVSLVVVGMYQIAAVLYSKVWCRKFAALIATSLWVGVAVGLYYIAGNVPSVGVLGVMILSLSIAALGLYEHPYLDK